MRIAAHPLRRLYRRWWWLGISLFVVVALALGFLGFQQHFQEQGESRTRWDALYFALQLFTLESGSVDGTVNLKLQTARFLAPAITVYAGVLALLMIFRREYQLIRLRFLQDHVVVCGLGRKGTRLVESLLECREKVVVIEPDESNDSLDYCRDHGVPVVSGSADDIRMLKMARVHRARMLISVTGDDGCNIESAVYAHHLSDARRKRPLKCMIHVAERGLQHVFRQHELFSTRENRIDLEFFDIYESGARIMLRELPTLVDSCHIRTESPRIVIVGFEKLGEALLVRAVRDWQIDRGQSEVRLRVTVIDPAADEKRDSVMARYPGICRLADLEFLTLDLRSDELAQGRFLFRGDGAVDVSGIYVCLNTDAQSGYVGLTLASVLGDCSVPIVVRMSEEAGLAGMLRATRHGSSQTPKIQPLRLLEATCALNQLVAGRFETLARAIHQGYLSRQLSDGKTSVSNPSVVPWEQLPAKLQESNRHQAAHIPAMLQAVNCELVPSGEFEVPLLAFNAEEIEILARREHERWVDARRAEGWTRGEAKDSVKKTSPYLTSWDKLPEDVRDLNRHAVALIPRVLAKADYEVRRRANHPHTEA